MKLIMDLKCKSKPVKSLKARPLHSILNLPFLLNPLSENNFVSNIGNFSGLNVLSLNIQSLSSKFEELKIFCDRIKNSGGIVSVLVLQEIWDVSLPNLFYIKDFELFTNTQKTSKAVGVAIYCKKKLESKIDTWLS